MKLTFILLTVAFLQVSAKGVAQNNVTFSGKKVKLETVFKSIEKQTGFTFFYRISDLEKTSLLTIDLKNSPLEEALTLILKDQPLTFSINGKTIFIKERPISTSAFQPEVIPAINPSPIDIHGRILDENGKPVIASVQVKGTNKGTTTNDNGEFELKGVDDNATLVISGVSIEIFEVKVGGRSELALSAKVKNVQGEEVIVEANTGYQRIPKERATGSFEVINNKELNRRVSTDILSRLEGVTTSVLFDRRNLSPTDNTISQNNIIIRGLSTLTESIKAPLIVVDNFPYSGNINNINPNDIEDITILKDAAAASIWGAKAGNGVIVITTKKGRYNQKTQLTLNSNISFTQKPDLFYYPSMSSSDYIDVETFLFNQNFYSFDLLFQQPAFTPAIEILMKRKAGLISSSDSAIQIDALRKLDVRNDFNKYFYRTSTTQQYSLNLTGGSEKIKYGLSGGFDKNLSALVGNDNQRTTVRSITTASLIKGLEMQLGLSYTNAATSNNNPGNYGSSAFNFRTFPTTKSLYPYAQFADQNGKPLAIVHDYNINYIDTVKGSGGLLDWHYRPLDELKYADNEDHIEDLLLNVGTNYKISNHLNIQLSYQYEHQLDNNENSHSLKTYFTRNLINLYFNPTTTDPYGRYPIPNSGGILQQYLSETKSQYGRGQINYGQSFGMKHQIVAIAGAEISEAENQVTSNTIYGYNKETKSSANVDLIDIFPFYNGLASGSSNISGGVSYRKTVNRLASFFSNAAYTYDKKYTVTLSARKDASNLFAVDYNNKWKPLWSAGTKWMISNEPFYHFKIFNELGLRATYGYQGNINNSIAPTTVLTINNSNNVLNQPTASISYPGDPDLRWESISQLNLAADFSLLNHRLYGSLEWYRKKSNNLILAANVDPTTGLNQITRNSASLKGNGWEMNLRSVNIDRGVKWQTQFSISHTSVKVTDYKLNEGGPFAIVQNSGLVITPVKGYNPYGVYSFPFAGLDPNNGDPMGYMNHQTSKDYYNILYSQKISDAQLIYQGSGIPTYFGYVNNTFSYKNLSLSVNVLFKLNYYFRKNTISYFELFSNGLSHRDYANRWQKPGDENHTTVPSMQYPNDYNRDDFYALSSANILKGDHIRLQDLRVDYDFGNQILKSLKITRAQFYIYANNLGIIWRANNERLDPDYDTGNAVFPPLKSISVGLSLSF